MDTDDPFEDLPQIAPLTRSGAMSKEEAIANFDRHLDRMPPPYDDATRYIRERDRERHRRWVDAAWRGEGREPVDAPPFRAGRLKKYRGLLHLKAIALLERGRVIVETNGPQPLEAILHAFSDGSAVLETTCGGSAGMRPMQEEDFDADRIAGHLEFAFLDARVRPIAGQEI